jgi:glucosamine--fructose-6-phosphate aminotransferase (isomerizing)
MDLEICESADVVSRIVLNRHAVAEVARRLDIGAAPLCVLCGRGSSGHAGVFLRYLIETRLHLPVSASAPSVITAFRKPLTLRNALFIVISQSGRSPDLVAATQSARASGARTVAIINWCRRRRQAELSFRSKPGLNIRSPHQDRGQPMRQALN